MLRVIVGDSVAMEARALTLDEAETRLVPIAGGELCVRSVGGPRAGDALVLIHGGPGISHRYMLGLERLASARRQVVSYDQRGVGGSPFDSDDTADYGLDAHASDLTAVAAAVEADRLHLLGHSWGGVIAMDYAGRFPDRVASLLLIDSCPPHIRDLEPGYGRFSERMAELVERGLIPSELPADPSDQLRAMAPVYFADPTMRLSDEDAGAFEVFPIAGELTAASLPTLDLTEGLSRFARPVLIVMGVADPFGVDWATATQRAFTSTLAQVALIEDCGHMGWLECPDRFFPVLESFLEHAPAENT